MKYAKVFLASNARKLLMSLGIIYIFTTILLIFNFYASNGYFYEQNHPYITLIDSSRDVLWRSECELMTFIAIIVSIIAGSMMFSPISNRSVRLSTLEIPVAQHKKFMTWFVVYLPVMVVTIWICFYLAQITRVCWTHLFTDFGPFAHVIPFHRIILLQGATILHTSDLYNSLPVYGSLIFLNSFFALGSVYFPKLSFLKTAISGAILTAFVALSAIVGRILFFGINSNTVSRFEILDQFPNFTCFTSGCLLFGALCCYALSFYRFKQTEIIDRW